MAIPWVAALKLIPWTDVIKAAPHVVKTAQGLLKKTPAATTTPNSEDLSAELAQAQAANPASDAGELALQHILKLQARIQALEQAQHDSAQLLEKMAEQQAQIVETVGLLRTGATRLARACAVLALGLVGLGGYVLYALSGSA